ncbi:MAG: class I SAM-dependent methyltransferase [Parachlamydiaceae bacterium]
MATHHSYFLIDSGNGRKLEKFGSFIIDRPCAQAVWKPKLPQKDWQKAHGFFSREGEARWHDKNFPESWVIETSGVSFKLSPTDFGHLGIFPEQRPFWLWMQEMIREEKAKREKIDVLNLFAYSGGSTLACAKAGAHVCHLDASKTIVAWARENATINKLTHAPIRWIVDDVFKFLKRELKRERRYDAIILDPPSFGRGSKGEVFKIEEEIQDLLQACKELLKPHPMFVLFSCHTPGFTPIAMRHLLEQTMVGFKGAIDCGEMVLEGQDNVFAVPSGTYARWQHD